ncbi:MAG: toxin-antitoxin system, toxin component, PIN family protein [Sphingomonas sp.]|nr:MAG: toxin-antitoxin system, toxin component, PIN family protein [Sphingomonas sp.]
MKFLIDECLHTSLVAVAEAHGHEARHVNWIGLSGEKDWDLMPRIRADDFTFVTNNARDFRRLYGREPLHAGLVIVVPQVVPELQRDLFESLLGDLAPDDLLINEVIEIDLDGDEMTVTRYELPGAES